MKKSDTHAFVNQLLICLLVTIGVGGSIGLGTVWVRHQISVTANSNQVLAQQIEDLSRRIAATTTLIESEQSPALLRQRNATMRIGLAPVQEEQRRHVTEDPAHHLRDRASEGILQAAPPRQLITLSL